MKYCITYILILLTYTVVYPMKQVVDLGLKGNELLIGMEQMKEGKYKPGIYALDIMKDVVRLVIPFGKSPKWSPDHKKIAYFYNSEVYIYNLDEHIIYSGSDICSYPIYPFDFNITWSPDSKMIFFRNDLMRGETVLDQDGKDVIDNNGNVTYLPNNKKNIYYVGIGIKNNFKAISGRKYRGEHQMGENISFSPDKEFIVYEKIKYVYKLNVVDSKIVISNLENDDPIVIIDDEIIKKSLCYNPIWQPNGDKIAFMGHEIGSDISKIYIYDTKTKKTNLLINDEKMKSENKYKNCEFVLMGWSKDGKSIIAMPINIKTEVGVLERKDDVFRINVNGDFERKLNTLGESYRISANITGRMYTSPENNYYAFISSRYLDINVDGRPSVCIIGETDKIGLLFDLESHFETLRGNLKPVSLCW